MMNTTVKTAVAAFLSLSVMESAAKVTLPQIYTDNMVVQQKWKAPFHGTASPDAVVRIGAGWLKDPVSVNAGPDGRWDVVLPTPKGGKGGFEVTFTDTADGSEVTLHNVTVGEVWLCSGQSNMEMPVAGWGKVLNYEQEIAGAVYPHIRLLQVKRHTDMVPQENTEVTGGGWQVCSPQSVEEFSSIAYFFARHLWKELDVPVGVIDCTWGGSPIESWLSYTTLAEAKGFKGVVEDFKGECLADGAIRAHYKELLERHGRSERCGYGKQRCLCHNDGFPGTIDGHTFYPAELHNAMLRPLARLGIKGVLWYQGENNADRAYQYGFLFPRLINDWRELWDNKNMPFYFVQLANWRKRKEVQPHSDWAYLRESQQKALHMPNTAMAVAVDVGDADDIHPKNKQEVARRLALIALSRDYGKKTDWKAPHYEDYHIEGDTMYLTFDAPAGDFMQKEKYDGFIVAGTEGVFHKAYARWDGDRLAVSAPQVKVPVAVRYAWADNPQVSLFGKSGLPVAPFRTDNW